MCKCQIHTKGVGSPKNFQLNLRQHEEVFFHIGQQRISNLEEGPRLEESLAQCLIKVKVESVVSVYVVPDPDRKLSTLKKNLVLKINSSEFTQMHVAH